MELMSLIGEYGVVAVLAGVFIWQSVGNAKTQTRLLGEIKDMAKATRSADELHQRKLDAVMENQGRMTNEMMRMTEAMMRMQQTMDTMLRMVNGSTIKGDWVK